MRAHDIERNLRSVGEELNRRGLMGEIVIVGGAFMLLVIENRETTRDVDAYFSGDPGAIRDAARIVAEREGLPNDWLNDAVKGFFYREPPTQLWGEYRGLRVYVASAEYVFAMKAVAGRPEDEIDLRALKERLELENPERALAIVADFVPERLLTARTRFLIESLFEDAAK